MKKNLRIYLEKTPENNKNPQTYKMFKKVKTKLEMYATGKLNLKVICIICIKLFQQVLVYF